MREVATLGKPMKKAANPIKAAAFVVFTTLFVVPGGGIVHPSTAVLSRLLL